MITVILTVPSGLSKLPGPFTQMCASWEEKEEVRQALAVTIFTSMTRA